MAVQQLISEQKIQDKVGKTMTVLVDEIGYEDYIYGEGVSLIEWANLIEEILPEHYTEIKIEKDLEKGFDYRRITICEY